MSIKKIIDSSISEIEFSENPSCGKYRIEILPDPNLAWLNYNKLKIILLSKQPTIKGVRLPFIHFRKALISANSYYDLVEEIEKGFPGYDVFNDSFRLVDMDIYPQSRIYPISFSRTSKICFMDEKQLNQWIGPIKRAVKQFDDKHYKTKKMDRFG